MGAEAIKELLAEIDIEQLSKELKEELEHASGQKKLKIIKRLEVVEAFRLSHNTPRVDDSRCRAGAPAGNPPDGAARRRQICHLRPE